MTPAQLADAILKAAGSGLRHYTMESRARICAQAERAIEEIKADWQPIETCPSDVCVLLYMPNLHETNPERIEAEIYHSTRGGHRHAWATHWMNLPNPPRKP